MREPRRLVDHCSDAYKRDLLRSWQAESPSREAFARTARSLRVGLGAGAGTLASTTHAAGASAGVKSSLSLHLVAAKWGGIGVVSGLLAVGGAQAVRSHLARAPAAAELIAVHPTSTSGTVPLRPLPSSLASVAPDGAHLPTEVSAPSASFDARGADRSPAQHVDPPVSIEAEIALLDRARAALARSEAQAALSSLDELRTLPGSATFSPEAMRLRIAALRQAGREAEARRLAERFVRAHPNSPGAAALQQWIAAGASHPGSTE